MAWFRVRIPADPLPPDRAFHSGARRIQLSGKYRDSSYSGFYRMMNKSNRFPSTLYRVPDSAGMKAFLFLAMGCVAMLLGGCRTVAVVDHGRPAYVRSGYHSRPYYSSYRRPYYYSGRSYDSRYRYAYRDGYRRSYSNNYYYSRPRAAGRVVVY